ncbi:MAG: hypothetical protein RBR34_07175 [Rhodospirillaceae bacterium]|jgi:hypothetical protein|nr:hypothetical protein [Rhodospirillaceae bacterium]
MVHAISINGSHFYNVSGVNIPSVTTILKPMSPFRNEKDNESNTFSKIFSQVGTYIHYVILKEFDDIDAPDFELPEIPWVLDRVKNSLEQWKQFTNDHKIEPINVEQFIYSSGIYPYAGRYDFLGYIDDKLTLMDLKTGGLYDYYPLQLSAYICAAKHEKVIDNGLLLQIDGNPKRNLDNTYTEVWYDLDQINRYNYEFQFYVKDYYEPKTI